MELSPFQRTVAFAVVVLALAGLGVYLFLPQASAGGGQSPGLSQPAGGTSGQAGGSPPRSGGTASPAPSVPGGTGSSGSGQTPDIYQWLPFTPSGLASAAQVTTSFSNDYGTFSYTESTAGYLAPMKSLCTTQVAQLIGRAYSAPGVVAARNSGKQVASATSVISSLRAFGPSSVTFIVAVTQQLTDVKGRSQQTTDYALTLTGSGSSWQVSDIELATVGNQ